MKNLPTFVLSFFLLTNAMAQDDCDIYVLKTYDDLNSIWNTTYTDYIPLANSDKSQILGLWAQKSSNENKFTFAFTFAQGKVCLGETIRLYIKFEGGSMPEIFEFRSVDYTECGDSYWVTVDSQSIINKFKTNRIEKIYTDNKSQISIDVDWLTADVILTSNKCLFE